MQVTITPKPEQSEVTLAITVPASDFSPYLERAARKLSKENPLKGFRPGKATLQTAIEAYGEQRVLNTALERAIPHFFVQAVLDHSIDAISRPQIAVESAGVGKDLAFTATVAVLPEVTVGDIAAISVEKRPVQVTDEDVAKELKHLARMRSTFIEVARPAQLGDTVTIDFKVSMNGTIMEGGESKNHPIHLGEGYFVPDFEEKLVGISAGDTRDFTIGFPDDFPKKELRGTTADVTVTAHTVQHRVIPELTDDFARTIGTFTDLAQLKKELTENLQREREQREQDRLQGSIADAVAERSSFGPIPAVLLDREIDRRVNELTQFLAYQQKTLEQYLAAENKTAAQLREELKVPAEKAVKVGLTLRAVAEAANITVPDEEVNEKVAQYLSRYGSEAKARQEIDPEELKDSFTSTLRNQKTLEYLEKNIQTKSP